jgi:hypothetical protein
MVPQITQELPALLQEGRVGLMPPGKIQLPTLNLTTGQVYSRLCQVFMPSRNQSNSNKIGQIQTKVRQILCLGFWDFGPSKGEGGMWAILLIERRQIVNWQSMRWVY